jgi:hypothetical protein
MDLTPVSEISSTAECEEERDMVGITLGSPVPRKGDTTVGLPLPLMCVGGCVMCKHSHEIG